MKLNKNHYISCYLLIAVITFGSVWSEDWMSEAPDLKAVGSFTVSIAWPFYWSVKIWTKKEML